MKFYIIAGEASGDLHSSNLIRALKKRLPEAQFRAWGGDLMQAAGAHLVKHYKDLAFMGFWEVIKNLPVILRNLAFCKNDIEKWQPDALILTDYPGFNLRIAKWARKKGLKVFYYISPQIWAWKEGRVRQIKRDVDKMMVILPFEKAFYEKHGVQVDFVGHPLLDVVKNFEPDKNFRQKWQLSDAPIIALLPGSRKQEIGKMLPVMLSIAGEFPQFQFVVAGAPSQSADFYKKILASQPTDKIKLVENETYQLLSQARAALVTSGTATLETALFGVPEIVCYKGSNFSYQIAKRLVKVKYISLVNLILDKMSIPELIQEKLTTGNLKNELSRILQPEIEAEIKKDFQLLREKLGEGGASARAAEIILSALEKTKIS